MLVSKSPFGEKKIQGGKGGLAGSQTEGKEPQAMALQSCALRKEEKETRTGAKGDTQEPDGHTQARLSAS